jgi:hypothetical protein
VTVRRSLPFLAGLVWLIGVRSASAAPADVEIIGGLGFFLSSLDTTYDASYVPSRVTGINQLFATPDPRSDARQFLELQGKASVSLGLGVNVYPHRVLGFQFLLDRSSVDIVGENSPHEVDLVWDSINFPSSDPVVREASFSFDAQDTEGGLDELALSFNLTARFGAPRTVSGSVSSGLTVFRFDGELERLGALAGWLGGHAVLFTELYEMSYSTAAVDALGFNLGGSVDFALGPRAAAFADGRFFWAPRTEAEVALTGFVSENVVSVPLSSIQSYLELPPISIEPGFFRVLFGVKFRP